MEGATGLSSCCMPAQCRCKAVFHWSLSSSTSPSLPPQALLVRYKGRDVDSQSQRKSVARFVGLDMPEMAAHLRDAHNPAEKYTSTVAAKVKVEDLQGVDNLKAQLFGVQSLLGGEEGSGAAAKKPELK